MIISFKAESGKGFVTTNGVSIPSEIINNNAHLFNEDGTGWVDLPAIVTGEDMELKVTGSGRGKDLGIEDRLEEQMRRKPPKDFGKLHSTSRINLEVEPDEDVSFNSEDLADLGNPGALFPGESITKTPATSLTGSLGVVELPADQFEFQLKETPKDQPITRHPALIEYDSWDDAYVSAGGLLHKLGFVPKPNKNGSVHKWFHPVMGDDRDDNRLLFDLETDDIADLAVKIFRLGARVGTVALKVQIKNALEQH